MREEKITTDSMAPRSTNVRAAYTGYVRKKKLAMVVLAIVVALLAGAEIGMGSYQLTPLQVLSALVGQGDSRTMAVVWNMRMPRVLTAIVAGISLSIAGCAFQSVLRNPLASASTLGISQGAAFGASVSIILLAPSSTLYTAAYEGVSNADPITTALCAFLGSMLSTLVIMGLSRLREMTPSSIVLAGVALSALFSAGTTLVQYFADDSQVAAVVFWTFGDLGRVNSMQLLVMALVAAFAAVFFHVNRWNLNAIESGEDLAHGLGVSVKRVRLSSMIVASAAAASVIAFCGIVNFVGLVAPHIMRRVLGADYRYLLPASAIAGAGLLLISDILCHVIVAPLILPISAITAFVGAPLFIYLLYKGTTA